MTIGVSHDPETGTVVLVDRVAQEIYDFAPHRARVLAADLRSAAVAVGAVLIIGPPTTAANFDWAVKRALHGGMADALDRNADLNPV